MKSLRGQCEQAARSDLHGDSSGIVIAVRANPDSCSDLFFVPFEYLEGIYRSRALNAPAGLVRR